MTQSTDQHMDKNERLWQIAKKRAGFKRSLAVYIIVNVFLWCLWLFTNMQRGDQGFGILPWPAWVTLGWGIGIAFQYVDAYRTNGSSSVEREYEKLKNQQ